MSLIYRIVQVGLGPIGREMARRAAGRKGYEVVGGVDILPDLIDKDLESLLEEEVECEGVVVGTSEEAIKRFKPDIALVTTVSDLARVVPICEEFLRAGVAVVSTCEEMAYPFLTHAELARRLDEAGKAGKAACLGTGINPGFILDLFPVILTGPMERITRLRARRVVDAAKRRGPLQSKVGAGLTPEQFDAKVKAGGFGHRGFMESLHMLCAAFGVETAGATTFVRPVLATRSVDTGFVHVEPGQVAGIHQGAEDREGRIILDLKMFVGAEHPGDEVEIEGEPPVKVRVDGGYQGDIATCAIALNAVPAIRTAPPGLRTMLDLPAIHAPKIFKDGS